MFTILHVKLMQCHGLISARVMYFLHNTGSVYWRAGPIKDALYSRDHVSYITCPACFDRVVIVYGIGSIGYVYPVVPYI